MERAVGVGSRDFTVVESSGCAAPGVRFAPAAEREGTVRMRTITDRLTGIALTLLLAASTARAGGGYTQTNLVSNMPGVAQQTDPNLINPWGISFSTGSPFWISNQGAGALNIGTSTLYGVPSATGGLNSGPTLLTVTIPNISNAAPSADNGPTGQVNTSAPGITTGASDFLLNGTKASFIFANLDGSISAWNGGGAATIMATVAGASFTGLGIGNSGGAAFLYAADQHSANVDIFNSSWHMTGQLTTDPNLPSGFTAFNVQNLGGILYVTYANPNSPLGGIVDEYRTDGTLLTRLITDTAGTHLQTPYGVAIAPAGWGQFGGDLLIGNNDGDGTINAYTLGGVWQGQLTLANGTVFSEAEMWGLTFGNGGNGGSPNVLYFAAGLEGQTNGLFGALSVPEPGSGVLGVIALGTLGVGWTWKKRRHPASS
jgi:uncharacterized protein (TIGR03118 family)